MTVTWIWAIAGFVVGVTIAVGMIYAGSRAPLCDDGHDWERFDSSPRLRCAVCKKIAGLR